MKEVISIVLALILVFSLTACGGNKAPTPISTIQQGQTNLQQPIVETPTINEAMVSDVLSKLERAYNTQDLYAIIQCFEPSESDLFFGILELFGLKGSALKSIMPFGSQLLASSGALDYGQWGKVKLTGKETTINGNNGTLTYNVSIKYEDGNVQSFDETIQTVKVDGVWYIANIQQSQETPKPESGAQATPEPGRSAASGTPQPIPAPPDADTPPFPEKITNLEESMENTIQATITMEDGDVIVLELYPNLAPQSVCNFVSLARQGFYDGLKFHRIIKGFMIQGGCPLGTGTGNPGYAIKGEFEANGFANGLTHDRGVLSIARAGGYNTAGSQFFIVHEKSPHLDGSYAAFGKVTSGIEVVDKLAQTPVIDRNGTVTPDNMPVIKSITIDSDVELPEPDKL